jgi:signal peptidase II
MRVLYLSLVILAADLLTKVFVKGLSIPFLGIDIKGMEYGRSVHIAGDWLKLTFIENPNMAFGVELGGRVFLISFALLASIGLVVYLYKHRKDKLIIRAALGILLAGALGNLVDRIFFGVFYGYAPIFRGNVVDFIDVDLFSFHIFNGTFKFWPIFNVADAAVTVGVLLLLATSTRVKPAVVQPLPAGSSPERPGGGEEKPV